LGEIYLLPAYEKIEGKFLKLKRILMITGFPRLRENFDPAAYDNLFNQGLDSMLPILRSTGGHNRLASMRWTNYIAACLRNAGFRDQGDLEERIHDVVVKLLVSPGGLFRGYDAGRHGPLDLRFKRSVSNAIKNMVQKERNRRSYLPSIRLDNDFVPGGMSSEDLPARPQQDHSSRIIDRFRKLLQTRLGDLAVAIFDTRLDGKETKSLVGLPELGHPGRWLVKRVVQQIKALALEYAQASGDLDFLLRAERLMNAEATTVARRIMTGRRRRVRVGA